MQKTGCSSRFTSKSMTSAPTVFGATDPTPLSYRPYNCPSVIVAHPGVSKRTLTPRRLAISVATSISNPTSMLFSSRNPCGGQTTFVAPTISFFSLTRSRVDPANAVPVSKNIDNDAIITYFIGYPFYCTSPRSFSAGSGSETAWCVHAADCRRIGPVSSVQRSGPDP